MRPDGAKLIPWAKAKPLTWNVTVPDNFADSSINSTSAEAGAATKYAATFRVETRRHRFNPFVYPVANETAGPYDVRARALIEEIGRRMTAVREDNNEMNYQTEEFPSLSREETPSHSYKPSTTTKK